MTYTITIVIQDEKQRSSNVKIFYPSAATYDQAVAYAQAVTLKIEPLVLGAIRSINVLEHLDLPVGLKPLPLLHSDVEEVMKIKLLTLEQTTHTLTVPTWDQTRTDGGRWPGLDVVLDADAITLMNFFNDPATFGHSYNLTNSRADEVVLFTGSSFRHKPRSGLKTR